MQLPLFVWASSGPWGGTVGDVNGDGYDDVLVGHFDGSVEIYAGGPAGLGDAPAWVIADSDDFVGALACGDLDGDGDDEVLVGRSACEGVGCVDRYDGDPLGPAWAGRWLGAGPDDGFGIAVLDATGDGALDVLIGTPADLYRVDLYAGAAEVASSSQLVGSEYGGYRVLSAVGDVNADGFDDAAVVADGVYVLYGGAAGLRPPSPKLAGDDLVAGGDIDGDGYSDVVVADGSFLLVYAGGPLGVASGSDRISLDDMPDALLVGDVNGDGWADVVTAVEDDFSFDDTDEDESSVRLGAPQGLGAPIRWSGALLATGIGDVNGDGRPDLVGDAVFFGACDEASEDLDADGVPDGCDRCFGVNTQADADEDGFCAGQGDCDDADPVTWLGAPEGCDERDNDCDGAVLEDEYDRDGDGFRPCEGDCDDGDPELAPGQPEILGNDVDENCNGLASPADEEEPTSPLDLLRAAGCGCTSDGAGGSAAWLIGAVALLRRRAPSQRPTSAGTRWKSHSGAARTIAMIPHQKRGT